MTNDNDLMTELNTAKERIINGESPDHSIFTSLIVPHLEKKFTFRPKFSRFDEILIDYLCSSQLDIGMLIHRYELTEEQAILVGRELLRFYPYTSDNLPIIEGVKE